MAGRDCAKFIFRFIEYDLVISNFLFNFIKICVLDLPSVSQESQRKVKKPNIYFMVRTQTNCPTLS